MKIGILETGDVMKEASVPHADYGPMFHAFLTGVDPDITTAAYAVYDDVFPASVHDADGWLISGSKHGVYEPHPWIPKAEKFVRDCVTQSVPLVGICFGHQLIAQALGGVVVKSEKGWGLGATTYEITDKPGWMPELDETSIRAIHQDQVVELPPEASVFATSEFCTYAGLTYGDPERPKAISLQPHPEFSADFVRTVLEVRSGQVIPTDSAQTGIASLNQNVDNAAWARAIVRYFNENRASAA